MTFWRVPAWLLVFGAVFSVLTITLPWNFQMMHGWMRWKDNLITFHTMCSMHHEIMYNAAVLHGNLNIMLTIDLLTSLYLHSHISTKENPIQVQLLGLENRLASVGTTGPATRSSPRPRRRRGYSALLSGSLMKLR